MPSLIKHEGGKRNPIERFWLGLDAVCRRLEGAVVGVIGYVLLTLRLIHCLHVSLGDKSVYLIWGPVGFRARRSIGKTVNGPSLGQNRTIKIRTGKTL